MAPTFGTLAYETADTFLFGRAPHPVTLANGLSIGGGRIIPELNFTLPPMAITQDSMKEVVAQYRGIIDDAAKRSVELQSLDLVVEIELLPPTTVQPEWGIEITKNVKEILDGYADRHGLRSAIRITPVDIREDRHSPHMWQGSFWDRILRTFEGCAEAGADLLAIESIGGKDLHDEAIMFCELDKSIFSLGLLGAMDMAKLWREIASIADRTGTIAAGDTACGFANTAMVLADRGMVPKVFSAVVRAVSAVRSLVAIEQGARGPHKDCGYEGAFVKAITGTPIAMEGKSSACAHLSPIGNVAACVADLWSNESVQNIKLLGGMAPTVSLEQLVYDCRLMNTAADSGEANAKLLRDWLADSDSALDPQAWVLRPEVVLRLSREIIAETDPLKRSIRVAQATIRELREAVKAGSLRLSQQEVPYLDAMERQIEDMPKETDALIAEMADRDESGKLDLKKYDLA